MNDTPIEWTDKSSLAVETTVSQKQPIHKFVRGFKTFGRQPLVHVAVAFRAITGRTRGYDVARCRFSALADRDDVIPGSRGLSAIGTSTLELVKDKFLGQGRNWRDAAFAGMDTLSHGCPILGISGVTFPLALALVRPAVSTPHLTQRSPAATILTPPKACCSTLLALLPARSRRLANIATGFARGCQSITPATVRNKLTHRVPRFTADAPFQPGGLLRQILIYAQTQPPGCYLNCSCFVAH